MTMDQTPEYCVFPTCPVLAELRQTVSTMHDDASALQVQIDDLKAAGRQARDDATAALDLVSRIRMALNDNGKRMQDELLAYCRELVEKEAGLIVAHARIKALEMQAPGYAELERERCFRIFMRYYDATNFTPDEIRSALKP